MHLNPDARRAARLFALEDLHADPAWIPSDVEMETFRRLLHGREEHAAVCSGAARVAADRLLTGDRSEAARLALCEAAEAASVATRAAHEAREAVRIADSRRNHITRRLVWR